MRPKLSTSPELFWAKGERVGSCLIWRGMIGRDGYGRVKRDGKTIRAHRLAWQFAHGPIPEGMFVCHNCPTGDNPACIEPSHLFLGTAADNNADMITKGRAHYTGPRNPATGDRNGARVHIHRVQRGDVWRVHHAHVLRHGEHNGRAKLTLNDVVAIRAAHQSGSSYSQLALVYRVTKTAIAKIIRGENWKYN